MKKTASSGLWLAICILLTFNAGYTVFCFILHQSRPAWSIAEHTADTYIFLQTVLWVIRCLFSLIPCLGAWLIRVRRYRSGANCLEMCAWCLMVLMLFVAALLTAGTVEALAAGQGPYDAGPFIVSAVIEFGIILGSMLFLFLTTRILRFIMNGKKEPVEIIFISHVCGALSLSVCGLFALNLLLPTVAPPLREVVAYKATEFFFQALSGRQVYTLSLFANSTLLKDLLPPIGMTDAAAAVG